MGDGGGWGRGWVGHDSPINYCLLLAFVRTLVQLWEGWVVDGGGGGWGWRWMGMEVDGDGGGWG